MFRNHVKIRSVRFPDHCSPQTSPTTLHAFNVLQSKIALHSCEWFPVRRSPERRFRVVTHNLCSMGPQVLTLRALRSTLRPPPSTPTLLPRRTPSTLRQPPPHTRLPSSLRPPLVRTGSGTGPPRGRRAPRVGISSTVFGVMTCVFGLAAARRTRQSFIWFNILNGQVTGVTQN